MPAPKHMLLVSSRISTSQTFQLQGLRCDLVAGRAALWEDVAQRVGVLLSAPAAFAGEHFVQVRTEDYRVGSHAVGSRCASHCWVFVLLPNSSQTVLHYC
jgi:hypothetical protein